MLNYVFVKYFVLFSEFLKSQFHYYISLTAKCYVSQLDVLVHRLVTLLADIGDSKSAESRVSDANLACRKLAVSHPVLLLR